MVLLAQKNTYPEISQKQHPKTHKMASFGSIEERRKEGIAERIRLFKPRVTKPRGLVPGVRVTITGGTHEDKVGTFFHKTNKTYRINIDGVGERSIKQKFVTLGKPQHKMASFNKFTNKFKQLQLDAQGGLQETNAWARSAASTSQPETKKSSSAGNGSTLRLPRCTDWLEQILKMSLPARVEKAEKEVREIEEIEANSPAFSVRCSSIQTLEEEKIVCLEEYQKLMRELKLKETNALLNRDAAGEQEKYEEALEHEKEMKQCQKRQVALAKENKKKVGKLKQIIEQKQLALERGFVWFELIQQIKGQYERRKSKITIEKKDSWIQEAQRLTEGVKTLSGLLHQLNALESMKEMAARAANTAVRAAAAAAKVSSIHFFLFNFSKKMVVVSDLLFFFFLLHSITVWFRSERDSPCSEWCQFQGRVLESESV